MKKLIMGLSIFCFANLSYGYEDTCGSKEGYDTSMKYLRGLQSLEGDQLIGLYNHLTIVHAYTKSLELKNEGKTVDQIQEEVSKICNVRD